MQVIKVKALSDVPKNYSGIVEYSDGYKEWLLNGKEHREDGPAVEYSDGSKYWHLNGRLHRVDGPAIEYADGSKCWYLNGEYHREDGPAYEGANGHKEWYVNDKFIFELYPEDQPFVIVNETEDQVKILTATETKWILNVPGLKELESRPPCK